MEMFWVCFHTLSLSASCGNGFGWNTAAPDDLMSTAADPPLEVHLSLFLTRWPPIQHSLCLIQIVLHKKRTTNQEKVCINNLEQLACMLFMH